MVAAFTVALFHHLAQDADHHPAGAFLFKSKIRRHGAQAALLGVQLDGVDDALIDHLGVERAADVIRGSQVKGPPHRVHGVLAGDHDHRDLFQQVFLVHLFQHRKTVDAGHMDVQQHDGNAGGVLFQQLQAGLAAGRLGNVEPAAQHLPQHLAVQLRVIHDEHALAAMHRRGGRALRLLLGDHGVLLHLGIGSQPLCVLHRRRYFPVPDPHTADAHRDVQMGVARNTGRRQLQPQMLQLLAEVALPHLRQKQQQPVLAAADEAVLLAQIPAQHPGHGFQHAVSGVTAIYVVGRLEVVHPQHRHTSREDAAAVFFLVIALIVRAGHRIAVQFSTVLRKVVEQLFAFFGVQQHDPVQPALQLQHAGRAFHLRKKGRHLVQLLPAVLHPAVGGLFFQRLPGSISHCLPGLHLLCSEHAHRGEHLAQLLHFLFGLLPGH